MLNPDIQDESSNTVNDLPNVDNIDDSLDWYSSEDMDGNPLDDNPVEELDAGSAALPSSRALYKWYGLKLP